MVWAIRIAKLGLIGVGLLVFGWLAAVVIGAMVLLWLLFDAESAFWSGVLD